MGPLWQEPWHQGPFERALVSVHVNPQPQAVVPV
jgi:hypothetical protein